MHTKVAEFHRAFGVTCADEPTLLPRAERDLRINLLAEEFAEFHAANMADDLVEMADALADIIYIAAGTALAYGLTRDWEAATIEALREEAVFDLDEPASLRSKALRRRMQHHMDDLFDAYVDAELTLVDAQQLRTIEETLLEVIQGCLFYATAMAIPIFAVFEEVHRSNMSKLGADGRPARRDDGKILKGPAYSPPDIAAILTA